MNTFKHSGDLGDITYSLPVIRELGGGKLYLSQSDRTRERMTEERMALIQPLLEAQPYIRGVEKYRGQSVLYDLDEFRDYWAKNNRYGTAIAEYYAQAFCLSSDIYDKPWLTVPKVAKVPDCPVIIHRSFRYQNPLFDWGRLIHAYSGRVAMVGSKNEYLSMSADIQSESFEHIETKDLLELACVIAGAELFVGNQSCPYAISEGLKKRTIQETWAQDPNCMFKRADAQYCPGARIDL